MEDGNRRFKNSQVLIFFIVSNALIIFLGGFENGQKAFHLNIILFNNYKFFNGRVPVRLLPFQTIACMLPW